MNQVSLRHTGEMAGDHKVSPAVSIFLPVFNEEASLERLHSRIIEAMDARPVV
jgi:hypothetical protein